MIIAIVLHREIHRRHKRRLYPEKEDSMLVTSVQVAGWSTYDRWRDGVRVFLDALRRIRSGSVDGDPYLEMMRDRPKLQLCGGKNGVVLRLVGRPIPSVPEGYVLYTQLDGSDPSLALTGEEDLEEEGRSLAQAFSLEAVELGLERLLEDRPLLVVVIDGETAEATGHAYLKVVAGKLHVFAGGLPTFLEWSHVEVARAEREGRIRRESAEA